MKHAIATTLALAVTMHIASGQIVINEIMRNPSIISDRISEWFELYNPTGNPVDINGWEVKDDGTNSHKIDGGGPLVIGPGEYLVMGNNADNNTNGGVFIDYEYPPNQIQLNGNDDELVLMAANIEVDRVNWDGPAGLFPHQQGAAMALMDPVLDNNVASSWCDASTDFGSGNFGTPGARNDCHPPPVVINEIMRNPRNIRSERDGEWFELYNPSSKPIDISGWTIKDDGSNLHVIVTDGPLKIHPYGYLVLGNNKNFATNGGVYIDYEYDGQRIKLNNEDDELVLLAGELEVDRVNWDSGATYPNTNGHAMALKRPSLDNNVASNWCEASTSYGAGDFGTPGARNDCYIRVRRGGRSPGRGRIKQHSGN